MLGVKLMDNLQTILNNEQNRKNYRYLLLDMLGITSELSKLYLPSLKQQLPQKDIAVVERPGLLHELSSCPHLICIGYPNKDINTDLLHSSLLQMNLDFLTTKSYVCGWLVTHQSIDEMAEWIPKAGLMSGQLCDMRFLPFYEPFRMQLLQDTNLTDLDWINVLFPLGLTYYYVDIQKKVRAIQANKESKLLPSKIDPKIVFCQNESANLFNLYINWYDIKEQTNSTVGDNDLINIIEYYYESSLLGLQDIKDRTIYVFYSMLYGNLKQHEHIKNIINDVIFNAPGTLAEQFLAIESDFKKLLK
ncbi:hypothetical protein ACGH6R_06110 [Gilliamella sp. CG13]|uniref:hypothetical protein n=1 Tax=Gilliamella sp. CG13 TaxID=3351502 RepID=UPI003987CD06